MNELRPTVPIVLGVTGHRDLRDKDLPELRLALVKVFNEFRGAYPDTPLIILSSLAEGADQLAAELALECARNAGVGAERVVVRAPLPMPKAAYRASTSFTTDEARRRFDGLRADPQVDCILAPLPPDGPPREDPRWWLDVAPGDDPGHQALRRACYASAGVYIVRHCHALIALWDGEAPRGLSGTAEIVRFALTGTLSDAYPRARAEPLGHKGDRVPVLVLHTPRADTAQPTTTPGARTLLLPAVDVASDGSITTGGKSSNVPLAMRVGAGSRFWRRILTSLGSRMHGDDKAAKRDAELRQFRETCQVIDDFNRDAARMRARLDWHLKGLDVDPPRTPFTGGLGARCVELVTVRKAASELAKHLDRWLKRAQGALFVLLLLGLLLFHLYAHWFDPGHEPIHEPFFLWTFLGTLGVAAALVISVWWLRLDQRRYDYRALAEALRVRRAWALAGLDASVADSYLSQLRSEVAWARRALLHVCPPPQEWTLDFNRLSDSEKRDRLDHVRKEWVEDQVGHFLTGYHDNHRSATWLRRLGFAFALVGWLMWPLLSPWLDPTHPNHWLLIGSGLLVVGGGLLIAICERHAHEELAKQYERMHLVFTNAQAELDTRMDRGDVAGAQAVLLALGREAITESAQWLILRRARPFELHIG